MYAGTGFCTLDAWICRGSLRLVTDTAIAAHGSLDLFYYWFDPRMWTIYACFVALHRFVVVDAHLTLMLLYLYSTVHFADDFRDIVQPSYCVVMSGLMLTFLHGVRVYMSDNVAEPAIVAYLILVHVPNFYSRARVFTAESLHVLMYLIVVHIIICVVLCSFVQKKPVDNSVRRQKLGLPMIRSIIGCLGAHVAVTMCKL